MVIKEKKSRISHGGRHFSFDVVEPVHVPVFTIGKCEQKLNRSNRICSNYGELGDGICIECWDRLQENRTAMAREKYLRKHSKYNHKQVIVEYSNYAR